MLRIRFIILFPFLLYPTLGVGYDKDELTLFRNRSSASIGFLCNLKFQQAIGNRLSLGLNWRNYIDINQTGNKFDLFARYYPLGVFEWFYIQTRASIGKHHILMYYVNEGGGTMYPLIEKKSTYHEMVYGGGFDIGALVPLTKKKHVFLDFCIGYNYYPFPENIPQEFDQGNMHFVAKDEMPYNGFLFDTRIVGETHWKDILTGPGRLVNFSISFGWVF